ncbi:MAG: type II secretion system F family protein [Lachnospiraceae bacterium]|nr:type II secretion system F family protein [Lachnospiraceae bacterium]
MSVLLVVIGTPFLFLIQVKEHKRKQKQKLNEQFKDAILSLAALLRAGYSVENSFEEMRREMIELHGEKSMIVVELKRIIRKLKLNVMVEELLEDFGKRSGIDDIKNFASVFKTAKRSGGDMLKIITKTARMIVDKCDIEREVSTVIAAKRFEERLMLIMPAAIVLYLNISNPGFLDVMYETIQGRLIMIACLIVYAGAFVVGEKIVELKMQ